MKKLGVVVLVLAILLAGAWLAKGIIAKNALTAGVKAFTGLEAKVEGVSVGIFNTLVGIKGLKIMNPEGFADKLMADIPEVFVDYDLGAFLKQKVHLEELRLNFKELVIVRGPDGRLNINALTPLLPKKQEKEAELRIDRFNLKIGKVAFKFYLAGKEESFQFDLNVEENYQDITSPKMLVSLILKSALAKTGILDFANINLDAVRNKANEVAGNIKAKADEAGKQIRAQVDEAGKQIQAQADELKKQVEQEKQDLKKSVDEFKGIFKTEEAVNE
ncbi:hypothetical protein ACFL1K_04340 [Candidatus Omnitrophota bacterium]